MKNVVAILHGALSEDAPQDEQDTLIQVETVSEALSQLGMRPIPVPLSLNLETVAETLRWVQPDLVFNLVESVNGQGRLIHLGPALLDALQLAYTGAGTEAMLLTSNKVLAKQWLYMAGIATPEWWSQLELAQEFPVKHVRYIVKSVWEHASVGLSEDSKGVRRGTYICPDSPIEHAHYGRTGLDMKDVEDGMRTLRKLKRKAG